MTPHEYLSTLTEQDVVDLAAKCQTTPLYLWKLARDIRRGKHECMHPRLASRLEVYSNKKVMRWESIPSDWFEVWPELIWHPDAPKVVRGVVQPAANDSDMRGVA